MPTAVQGSDVVAARPQLWRITDRRTFQDLRRRGRRVRRGPLTLTWLPPALDAAGSPPRAGFAVGKGTGGAVVRNRVRRRLRAALRLLVAEGRLAPGTYLLGGTAELATMPWPALLQLLDEALAEVQPR
jgi:ribonuclease P protein component